MRIQFCMTIFGSSLLYLAMSVIEIKSSCVPSPTTQICTPSAVMCPLICLSILAPFQTKIRQISHCQPSFHIEHMFVLIISEANICSSLDLYERRKTRRARSTWLRAPQKLASQNVTEPPTHSDRPPNTKAPRGLFRTYGAHRQLGQRTLCAVPVLARRRWRRACWPLLSSSRYLLAASLAAPSAAAAARFLRR